MSEELATDARTDSERRGITIGILVVALLCLSLFFVWHHYGVAGSGEHPASTSMRRTADLSLAQARGGATTGFAVRIKRSGAGPT